MKPIPLHCRGPTTHREPSYLPASLRLPVPGMADLRLPLAPSFHSAIHDLNPFRPPSGKGAAVSADSEKGALFHDHPEKGALFHADTEKGVSFHEKRIPFCADPEILFDGDTEKRISFHEKRNPFCADPEKGILLHADQEKGILFHSDTDKGVSFHKKGIPFRADPEKGILFHTDTEKGTSFHKKRIPFHDDSDKGVLLHANTEKGIPFQAGSEKRIALHADSEKEIPLPAYCEKGIPLRPTSEKLFPLATEKETSFHEDTKKGISFQICKKGIPLRGESEEQIPFHEEYETGIPLQATCQKGDLFRIVSEKRGLFQNAAEKAVSLHEETERGVVPFRARSEKVSACPRSEKGIPLGVISERGTSVQSDAEKASTLRDAGDNISFSSSLDVMMTPFHAVPDSTSSFQTNTDKLGGGILTPFPPPPLPPPHPLALFQHLRRHHNLVMSERLAQDVILLPKTSPVMTSASLPTPNVLQSFLSALGSVPRGPVLDTVTASLGPAAAFPSLLMSQSLHATSPYGRKVFPCPQCRYSTDRRNNLKRHMLTMHQLTAKLLECCGVLFRTKAALREHALVFHYHGYSCFYCGRRFCRKALLKRHLAVHSGQKEFLCSICDYATSHKSNLERHRRVHVRQDDVTSHGENPNRHHHRHAGSSCDDVKSDVIKSRSHLDCVSFDGLSESSGEEEEEIIDVHGD
ncbi:hypothetical protein ACOMHN_015387 [Nucella lapillus]